FSFFFFITTPPTELYTLSLHDALPISLHHPVQELRRAPERARPRSPGEAGRTGEAGAGAAERGGRRAGPVAAGFSAYQPGHRVQDRKSTRLNSSHSQISYAVFCLKKKK